MFNTHGEISADNFNKALQEVIKYASVTEQMQSGVAIKHTKKLPRIKLGQM